MATRLFDDATERSIALAYEAGTSSTDLARTYDTTAHLILKAVRRAGGQVRSISEAKRGFTEEQDRAIGTLYEEGMSGAELASLYGVSLMCALSAVRRSGVAVRDKGGFNKDRRENRTEDANGYIGRYRTKQGYVCVAIKRSHPYASMCNSIGQVLEHRLVMAQTIGRPLTTNESVHHINGQRDDNRPANLQLHGDAHSRGHAHRCIDCGSTRIEHSAI